MSKSRLKLFITMALSVLILGYWGFYEPAPPPVPKTAQDAEKEIDGFMIESVTVDFDQDGRPHRQLSSSRATHYPALDKTRLQAPEMFIFRRDKVPVRITAEEGEIGPGNQQVELHRDVDIIEQEPRGLHMETEYLRIEPENDYAETHTAVTLHHATGQMRAIGMQAFLAEDRVKLLNEVRGIHEP